jgi:thiamine transporter ThiT
MMLAAAVPGLAGPLICRALMGESAPLAVLVIPAVWVLLFLWGRSNPHYALLAGMVWGLLSLVVPLGLAVRDIRSALAVALGLPVCPFSLIGSAMALFVLYFGLRGLRELPAAP